MSVYVECVVEASGPFGAQATHDASYMAKLGLAVVDASGAKSRHMSVHMLPPVYVQDEQSHAAAPAVRAATDAVEPAEAMRAVAAWLGELDSAPGHDNVRLVPNSLEAVAWLHHYFYKFTDVTPRFFGHDLGPVSFCADVRSITDMAYVCAHFSKDADMNLIAFAMDCCIRAHHGQYRKNATGEPYCLHPLRVMLRLQKHGYRDAEILAAALLHDVVEDTSCTLVDVDNKFGTRVASIVGKVTTDAQLSKLAQKRAQLDAAGALPADAAAVKLADRIDNVESFRGGLPTRWTPAYATGYLPHSMALSRRIAHSLVAELAAELAEAVRAVARDVMRFEWDDAKADAELDAFYALLAQTADTAASFTKPAEDCQLEVAPADA